MHIINQHHNKTFAPLESVTLCGAPKGEVCVRDGQGREYFRGPSTPGMSFVVGGALGGHTLKVLDGDVVAGQLHFQVEAKTFVDDGGDFKELFDILLRTLRCYSPSGEESLEWQGRTYHYFVSWILDHFHVAKGMRYFSDATGGLVELLARVQREDGMIWSFARPDSGPGFFDTRDAGAGYTRRGEGLLLVRQPAENHCEANFVGALFLAWQSGGDDEWMKKHLDAAMRALDYSRNDRARWSEKFGLLKRGYTIDSWDFQVEDEYSVPFPLGTDMLIDPDRTKFGIFFGDNTGYAHACSQLARMLERAGRSEDAERFRQRAAHIRERLSALSWNGKFFTHRVEEDPDVRRDLGVDEKSQLAMSNAYSLNRGIAGEQSAAILRTYQELREHLPDGSPGEWYAMYPPFERGFGPHSQKWQYMNGGVHGHAAGELARGAFEHGFEAYGADILRRLLALAKRTDGQLHFAYTGAFPNQHLEPAHFTPLDLAPHTNMKLSGGGADGWMGEAGNNDLSNLPIGAQELAGVPFHLGGRCIALSSSRRASARIEVNDRTGAVYLLHAASGIGASGMMGAITWEFEEGEEHAVYLHKGQHGSGWWFPELSDEAKQSGQSALAWQGPNAACTRVGVCWTALPNPRPDAVVRALRFDAALDGATYALLGLTLASRAPQAPVSPLSTGGPDNWTGGTVMAALLEGLAGITDEATALRCVRLAPRWKFAATNEARVCACYGGSNAYVAYRYHHDSDKGTISLQLTGSGEEVRVELPLPCQANGAVSVRVGDRAVEFVRLEGAVEFGAALPGPLQIEVSYER